MAHPEHFQFVRSVRDRWPHFFVGTRVLDIGSRDVNGGVRELFDDADYVGCDCFAGNGVDVVCLGHEFDAAAFDVALTCETLEHDPHWQLTVANMARLLVPGGLFVGTWAGPKRPLHDEGWSPQPGYYRNISARQFRRALGNLFVDLELTEGRERQDVYAVGFRPSVPAPPTVE